MLKEQAKMEKQEKYMKKIIKIEKKELKLAENENKRKLKQLRQDKRLEDIKLAMVRTLFKH